MAELSERQCVPCRGGVPPLKGKEIDNFLRQLEGRQLLTPTGRMASR